MTAGFGPYSRIVGKHKTVSSDYRRPREPTVRYWFELETAEPDGAVGDFEVDVSEHDYNSYEVGAVARLMVVPARKVDRE